MADRMDLSFSALRALYRRDDSIRDVFRAILDSLDGEKTQSVWIHRASSAEIYGQVERQLQRKRRGEFVPLYGLPFAVKDNIDVLGMPTTAACPAFSYDPDKSAPIVEKLVQLGAICLGKTNMDQHGTGLTGTRSPYGICPSVYDARYIGGGSSSGSAVAVAKGQVSFALGTDSGGSGRIPAGYNNIVGLKPTIGALSLNGVVPNSRCFDCPTVFALNVADVAEIFEVVEGYDESDPFSKQRVEPAPRGGALSGAFRFAVPASDQREWYGAIEPADKFNEGVARFVDIGGEVRDIDFALFREAGRMMLNGPWVAERKAGIRAFFEKQPDALLDVVRKIFDRADQWSAVDVFEWTYRLMELRRRALVVFKDVDFLLVPTAPRPFTIEEVNAAPIERNIEVGYYSYFVNLLDLCAISVPNGFLDNGMPSGLTLVAPAWHDRNLVALAQRLPPVQEAPHRAARQGAR